MSAIASSIPLSLSPRKYFLGGTQTYKGAWKLYGFLLSLFGYAFRVQDGSRCFYVNRASFVEQLTKGSLHDFSKSATVDRIAMEVLNPIIGDEISTLKVQALFTEFRSADFLKELRGARQESSATQMVEKRLEAFKNRHLTILTYDANELTKKLRPGDLIFKKLHESNSHIVVTGQKLFQPFIIGRKEREGYKYCHVALYIGNGKIAEAVPHCSGSEVRILRLDDPRFALDAFSKNQYLISRPKDAPLGEVASEVAANVAVEIPPPDGSNHCQETPFKYTKIEAFRSILHPSWFGPFARYRYLKQYIDDHTKHLPHDFLGLKSFFCSYFVGYCFQTAESRRIMPKLLGENDGPPMGLTALDTAIFRGLWARLRRIQVWSQMSRHVQMQFDAKRTTPHDLRNFVVTHPNLFQDTFLIQGKKL